MQYSVQRLRPLFPLKHKNKPREESPDSKFKRSWKKTAIKLCAVASIFAIIASTLGFYAFQQQVLRNSKAVRKVAKELEGIESEAERER